MLETSRVSTLMAVACPPASRISRVTVLIVDCGEFGSGGKGVPAWYASLVDLAATTTGGGGGGQSQDGSLGYRESGGIWNVPAYPLLARSRAICLPMPREAPTTRATFCGNGEGML